MLQRSLLRLSVFAAGCGLALASFGIGAAQDSSNRGRKYKAPPPSARIEITIVRDINSKPIENAAVIFHPMEGDKDKGVLELKTNEDGKAIIDVLPIGDTVRMQVIAAGFQTYGQDYKVDKPQMVMEIRLKRPGEQYSIYKDKGQGAGAGDSSGGNKETKSPQNAPPNTSGDRPAGSASQPEAQPGAGPSQPQAK
jgi:hypothetical protein